MQNEDKKTRQITAGVKRELSTLQRPWKILSNQKHDVDIRRAEHTMEIFFVCFLLTVITENHTKS